MTAKKIRLKTVKEDWRYLGHIPTKLVGWQYCGNVTVRVGEVVHFALGPDNPVDSDAIMALNGKNRGVAYLPRYDAAVLAPAIREGRVVLKGVIESWGRSSSSHSGLSSMKLRLEIYGGGKCLQWFRKAKPVTADDMLHNMLLEVWKQADILSADTIRETRDLFRDTIHHGDASPRTALIYRLLRGKAADREQDEMNGFRAVILDFLAGVDIRSDLTFGIQTSWERDDSLHYLGTLPFPYMKKPVDVQESRCVIPIYPRGYAALPPPADTGAEPAAPACVESADFTDETLVNQLAYPAGACGAVFVRGGQVLGMELHASAAAMEVEWFQTLKRVFQRAWSDDPVPWPNSVTDPAALIAAAPLRVSGHADGARIIRFSSPVDCLAVITPDMKLRRLALENPGLE
ncbi:MAG: HIRAN domain-containing protein [Lentisphaeria bacterium]|nr:HIRAN domain-containing protein [Lentisphaeria bacterium]